MRAPFEDFDEELKENADQELSFTEKALIRLGITFVKVLIWKAKRVKTYGDIYKLASWFEKKGDSFAEKWDEKAKAHEEGRSSQTEAEMTTEFISDAEEAIDDLKNHVGYEDKPKRTFW